MARTVNIVKKRYLLAKNNAQILQILTTGTKFQWCRYLIKELTWRMKIPWCCFRLEYLNSGIRQETMLPSVKHEQWQQPVADFPLIRHRLIS